MLKDVTYHQLKAILDYIYNGEVNIPQDQVDGFFRAAEFLQIKGLLRNSLEDTIIDPTEPSFKEEKSSQDSIFALDRLSKNVGGDLPLTSRPVPPLVPRRFDPLVPSTSSEASTSSRKRTRRCRSENKDTHFEDPAIAYPSIVLYEHNEWEHESKNFLEEDINNMGFEIPTNPGTEFSKTNDLRPYGCDCGSLIKTKKHQTHECGVEPAFCCDYCSKKFKRQWDLKMHVSRRHVPKKNK
uniref:C2H2-type domain-containing protein n=1 Tax=Megaselia scalaris TaxID=36166 RepID=T1H2S0_MEGSC